MDWLSNFFNLSKGEKYGFWLLIALIITGLSLPAFIEQQTEPIYRTDPRQSEAIIDQFMAAEKQSDQASGDSQATKAVEPTAYFKFDPNKVTFKELERLGVPGKLAHTILNYREAGGRFHDKADLKAIYGMPDSTYQRLKPCISLPPDKPKAVQKTGSEAHAFEQTKYDEYDEKAPERKVEKSPKKRPVALNQADSAALTKVYGIGDFFAGEIIERRKKLGGYANFQQLLAIYNFDSSALAKVKPQLSLNPDNIQKRSLNQGTFEGFLKHPYLDYAQVKAIFDFRDRVDTIRQVEALKKQQILGQAAYQKLKPYLKP